MIDTENEVLREGMKDDKWKCLVANGLPMECKEVKY